MLILLQDLAIAPGAGGCRASTTGPAERAALTPGRAGGNGALPRSRDEPTECVKSALILRLSCGGRDGVRAGHRGGNGGAAGADIFTVVRPGAGTHDRSAC